MQKNSTVRGKFGSVIVIIEGFFVERFINLCRINNIEIWNIRNINGANIEFEIQIKNYKTLKKIARKTKCKMKIKNKKGLYFFVHKYRKRKPFLIVGIFSFCIILYLSTLIWNIEIEGLEKIKKEELIKTLKESEIYVGKCRLFIKPQEAVKYVRANIPDIVWITVNLRGTNIEIKLKERGDVVDVEENNPTHIVAKKAGVITKIVAEDGTRIVDKNNYIEKGNIAICGIIENEKTNYTAFVKAKGILRANVEYEEEFEILNKEVIRKYDGKKYILLGFNINNKEFTLNYLIKNKKYDITKGEYGMNIFKIYVGFNIFTASSYEEQLLTYTKSRQKEILIERINQKIEKVITKDVKFVSKEIEFTETKNSLKAKVKYTLNENIAKEEPFSNLED